MAEVDPDDDAITRYVVRHYRFDPERHERRHVVVAAYDSEREMRRRIERIGAELARRRDAGEVVNRREHASGGAVRPGDRERAATGHAVRRAIDHGVSPRSLLVDRDLPRNMAVFGADDWGERFSQGWVPRSRWRRLVSRWRRTPRH